MTAADDELLRALTDADPTRLDQPPAKGSERYLSILEVAMRKETAHETVESSPRKGGARSHLRLIPRPALVAAAVLLIALLAATIVVLRPGNEANAFATVQAAAVKTGKVERLRATLSIEYVDGSSSITQGEMNGQDARIDTRSLSTDGSAFLESIVVIGDQMWEAEDNGDPITITPGERLAPFANSCEAIMGAALETKAVSTEGSESIRDVSAKHYGIVLDSASRAALAKLSPGELAWFELEYPEDVNRLDVWVADGLVHRLVVESTLGKATVDFYDFDADISITPPTAG